jgi:hypothetical protein
MGTCINWPDPQSLAEMLDRLFKLSLLGEGDA